MSQSTIQTFTSKTGSKISWVHVNNWLLKLRLSFFFFWLHLEACGILVPRPGMEPEPVPPIVEVWTVDHWTTREVPRLYFSYMVTVQVSICGNICVFCTYFILYLLLLLSHFNHVQLCATLWTAAHQAPLSTGFSRQEYWSGLPFPSPTFYI